MRRVPVLLSIMFLLPAACAQPGADPGAPAPSGAPDAAFTKRAAEVVAAWRSAPGRDAWRDGFVPLEDLTVLAPDAKLDDDTKMAFANGWFRSAIDLPATAPAAGTVKYPAGSQQVPLLSAAQAYAALDKGDPPPCPRGGRTPAPAPVPSDAGPDGSVGRDVVQPCIPLTVTAAKLGTVSVRTSRGPADAPAWIFTVEELSQPIARVAVAPAAVAPAPVASPSTAGELPGLVSAQDLTRVDGATLGYRLGVGSCDKEITPLVHETEDVVVVGGSVTRSTEMCTLDLKMAPVTVTLRAPIGSRPVLDALTGQGLVLTRQPS
ncbi:MAG TPA: hypothetical protein VF755_18655 [Catenuloplanes sp.]